MDIYVPWNARDRATIRFLFYFVMVPKLQSLHMPMKEYMCLSTHVQKNTGPEAQDFHTHGNYH